VTGEPREDFKILFSLPKKGAQEGGLALGIKFSVEESVTIWMNGFA
jgi:hypothetical protein